MSGWVSLCCAHPFREYLRLELDNLLCRNRLWILESKYSPEWWNRLKTDLAEIRWMFYCGAYECFAFGTESD